MNSWFPTMLLVAVATVSHTFGQVDRRTINEETIHSSVLGENRKLLVSTPPGYEFGNEKYFVVYVLDGNINTAFTCGIAELLYQSGYPKLIIVGIPNTHRSRDLTPSAVEDTPSGGGASKFLEFIEQELIPHIDKNYRTHEFKVLVGHSFGGLFGGYAFCQKPQLFDGIIAITPTVVYDEFKTGLAIKDFISSDADNKSSFFFSVGDEPGPEGDAVLRLHRIFKENAKNRLAWRFKYYPEENHSTTPLIATLDGLRFIFGDFILDENLVKKGGLQFAVNYYDQLQNKFGIPIKIPQRILMNYGYHLMEKGSNNESREVFELYERLYPTMTVPLDALASIHLNLGNKEKAINYMDKFLQLDPGNLDAAKKLESIKNEKN